MKEMERKQMKLAKEGFDSLKSPTSIIPRAPPLNTPVIPGSKTKGWAIYNCKKGFNNECE